MGGELPDMLLLTVVEYSLACLQHGGALQLYERAGNVLAEGELLVCCLVIVQDCCNHAACQYHQQAEVLLRGGDPKHCIMSLVGRVQQPGQSAYAHSEHAMLALPDQMGKVQPLKNADALCLMSLADHPTHICQDAVLSMAHLPLLAACLQALSTSQCCLQRCGTSYVKLPQTYPRLPCATRTTDMDGVLNNDWVSVTSGSEDYSFKVGQHRLASGWA